MTTCCGETIWRRNREQGKNKICCEKNMLEGFFESQIISISFINYFLLCAYRRRRRLVDSYC